VGTISIPPISRGGRARAARAACIVMGPDRVSAVTATPVAVNAMRRTACSSQATPGARLAATASTSAAMPPVMRILGGSCAKPCGRCCVRPVWS